MKNYNLLFCLFLLFTVLPCFTQDYSQDIELAKQYMKEEKKTEALIKYNEIANGYLINKNYNESAKYFRLIVEINEELKNRNGVIEGYKKLAFLYMDSENYESALPYLNKILEYNKNKKNKKEILETQISIGLSLSSLEQYSEAVNILEEASATALEIIDFAELLQCYELIYDNYDKLGQLETEKAKQVLDKIGAVKIKIAREKEQKIKTDAETQVNIAHAEKEQTEQELNIKSKELRKTKDTLQIVEKISEEQKMIIKLKDAEIRITNQRNSILIAGLIVLSILILFIVRANRKIKQQKNIVEKQNKEITSSINYAQTIQQAMLPDLDNTKDLFDTFIIYHPKDIVSGDFYWISKITDKNNKLLKLFVAVVDCTGHGVPGAFMSMIGNRLLNELVNKRQIEDPKEILNLLNIETIKALRQDQTDNKDGMDLSICCFEYLGKSDLKVTFSGAKRNLLIIRDKCSEIETLKGDRHSIGGHRDSNQKIEFTNKQTQCKSGDQVYMLTDGIIDQNSLECKRFGTKRLEELLIINCNHSAKKQKELIENELSEFMKDVIQRDDITLMGLKIL